LSVPRGFRSDSATSSSFSADSKKVAISGEHGLKVFDVATGKVDLGTSAADLRSAPVIHLLTGSRVVASRWRSKAILFDLTVRGECGQGARKVIVKPIASELGLRHLAGVRHNRAIVDKLSGGRIGYIHVPNTAIDGHRELFKGFRPLFRVKDAMIIDDRYDGGGWIPSDMAMALGQPVLSNWVRRDSQLSTTPTFAFEGPRAMPINGYSSSGGDAFPFYFRKLGLGKLIGKKTWGGARGLLRDAAPSRRRWTRRAGVRVHQHEGRVGCRGGRRCARYRGLR